jgi:hypothetical protein
MHFCCVKAANGPSATCSEQPCNDQYASNQERDASIPQRALQGFPLVAIAHTRVPGGVGQELGASIPRPVPVGGPPAPKEGRPVRGRLAPSQSLFLNHPPNPDIIVWIQDSGLGRELQVYQEYPEDIDFYMRVAGATTKRLSYCSMSLRTSTSTCGISSKTGVFRHGWPVKIHPPCQDGPEPALESLKNIFGSPVGMRTYNPVVNSDSVPAEKEQ